MYTDIHTGKCSQYINLKNKTQSHFKDILDFSQKTQAIVLNMNKPQA